MRAGRDRQACFLLSVSFEKVIIPAFGDPRNPGHVQVQERRRPVGNADQLHPRFFQRLISLLIIAAAAANDHVLPAILPTAALGNNVVDRQVVAGFAAILAGVVIPQIDIFSRQHDFGIRKRNVVDELDDLRQPVPAVHKVTVELDRISFSLIEQRHCSLPGGDIDRLMGRVQHQDLLVHQL